MQVRLHAAHQVDVHDWPLRVRGSGEDQTSARGPGPEQVGDGQLSPRRPLCGSDADRCRHRQRVARLVEVEGDARRPAGRRCRWFPTHRRRRTGCGARRTLRRPRTADFAPASPWRRIARSRGSASNRPRRCAHARCRSGHRRSCPRAEPSARHPRTPPPRPCPRSRERTVRCASSNPSFASERYQTNASSWLMSTSANPSPSTSTKRRFGSRKSMCRQRRESSQRLEVAVRRARGESRERLGVRNELHLPVTVAGPGAAACPAARLLGDGSARSARGGASCPPPAFAL